MPRSNKRIWIITKSIILISIVLFIASYFFKPTYDKHIKLRQVKNDNKALESVKESLMLSVDDLRRKTNDGSGAFYQEKSRRVNHRLIPDGEGRIDLRGLSSEYDPNSVFNPATEQFRVIP